MEKCWVCCVCFLHYFPSRTVILLYLKVIHILKGQHGCWNIYHIANIIEKMSRDGAIKRFSMETKLVRILCWIKMTNGKKKRIVLVSMFWKTESLAYFEDKHMGRGGILMPKLLLVMCGLGSSEIGKLTFGILPASKWKWCLHIE